MINGASLNNGESDLLGVCGTRLRVAELLYMGEITWGDEHAIHLVNKDLIDIAIARCRDGKAKPLTDREKKYLHHA